MERVPSDLHKALMVAPKAKAMWDGKKDTARAVVYDALAATP